MTVTRVGTGKDKKGVVSQEVRKSSEKFKRQFETMLPTKTETGPSEKALMVNCLKTCEKRYHFRNKKHIDTLVEWLTRDFLIKDN